MQTPLTSLERELLGYVERLATASETSAQALRALEVRSTNRMGLRMDGLPPKSATLAGNIFAPRSVFGDYIADTLAPFLADGRIRHLRSRAEDVYPDGAHYRIKLGDGGTIIADAVFLALTHPEPAIPAPLSNLSGEALIANVFAPDAFATVTKGERLLVVGSGLTSADILASLNRRGHAGPIHVISRHGWRSKPHGPTQPETAEDFTVDPATTACGHDSKAASKWCVLKTAFSLAPKS